MISSDAMLEALERAGDFTIRMIRGVFAEGAFAADVLPTLPKPWREIRSNLGDPPHDFLLTDEPEGTPGSASMVRVQVKLQRSAGKKPLQASQQWKTLVKWPATHYVVEVQRSRKGEKNGQSTRPYRFGEFDILAVSLGPATGNWSDFMYTVERWLLPDPVTPAHLLTFQPVSPVDTGCWTSDFLTAVRWLRSGQERRIEGELPTRRPPSQPRRRNKS